MDEKKIENSTSGAEELVEKAETALESAESELNEVNEKADEVKEEIEKAEEAVNEAEAAVESAENEMNDDADIIKEETEASDADEPVNAEDYDPTKLKGQAPNSVPVDVKKKKPLNKTNVIVIVVCAVIVVACLVFVGFKVGWFDKLTASKGKIDLCDLSSIEVQEDEVEVTDDTVDYYVESILSSLSSTEEVTDGEVEDGDTVNIDYDGVYAETGEAFDGGSSEGYDLTIGSGTFIDGFEDGLIGKKVGDTVELALQFPEDYSSEELAGKDVIFTVTINSISRTTTPEYTDEWVQEYSAKYCPTAMSTTDEFDEYCKGVVEDYYMNQAIYKYILYHSEIISYDEEKEAELMEYSNDTLSYYSSMYGIDADTYATYMGYDDAEAYNKAQADEYLKTSMIANAVCDKLGISYSDEDVDAALEQYMKDQKYIDTYTVDEFKENSGETWMWLFENLQFKYEKAMEALRDNVVSVEETTTPETTTEETTAEETTAEETSAEDTEAEETTVAETTAAN